jgi:2-hydroxy-6-oxonona-2,4-dienedioate hydrolase
MASFHKTKLKSVWENVYGVSMHARLSEAPALASVPTVVLVHGLSVSSGYMVPTALHLAPYYRVYAPDLPGFGKSAKPAHILSIPELADALADWMTVMKLPPPVLLGNSLGCQVIVDFALRYPERITHAVLVGPTMDPRARTIHQEAFRVMLNMFREPFPFLPVAGREYLAAGLRRTIRTLKFAFADRMEEHLTRVQVPTLIVRGARDPIVPQRWVEEVHRLLPDSQLVVVRGAAHAVNFDSPEKLVNSVRSFLSQ